MKNHPTCIIFGAGGHGRVVLDIIQQAGQFTVAGFVDSNIELTGRRIDGVPVLGTPDDLLEIRQQLDVCHAIVAVGDNGTRRALADRLETLGFVLINAIHPSANIARNATLGRNVVVAAGALVCAHCQIGDSVILNTGCIIDHETMIGTATHVCPGARLAGRVTIESGAFIGIGATIIQSLRIGYESKVGAGAVVIDDVDPMVTVIGVPARTVSARSKSRTMLAMPSAAPHIPAARHTDRPAMSIRDHNDPAYNDVETVKTSMTGGTYPDDSGTGITRRVERSADAVSAKVGEIGLARTQQVVGNRVSNGVPNAKATGTPAPAYIGTVPFDR